MIFLKFLLILIVASFATCIELNCRFEVFKTNWGEFYTCNLEDLVTTENDRKVTKINGIHVEGKTDGDVEKVFGEFQNCPFLPTNIGEFFKNLSILYIRKSGIKTIKEGDLDGLDKLRVVDLSHSSIEKIPKNFFKGHSTIEIIAFYECHLTLVEPGALDPLVKLKQGHFRFNPCIDLNADRSYLLGPLKHLIKKCDGTKKFIEPQNSSDDKDYTISQEEINELESCKKQLQDLKQEQAKLQLFTTPKPCTTPKPTVIKEINYVTKTAEKSFIERNAVAIIFVFVAFLIISIALNVTIYRGRKTNQLQSLREDF